MKKILHQKSLLCLWLVILTCITQSEVGYALTAKGVPDGQLTEEVAPAMRNRIKIVPASEEGYFEPLAGYSFIFIIDDHTENLDDHLINVGKTLKERVEGKFQIVLMEDYASFETALETIRDAGFLRNLHLVITDRDFPMEKSEGLPGRDEPRAGDRLLEQINVINKARGLLIKAIMVTGYQMAQNSYGFPVIYRPNLERDYEILNSMVSIFLRNQQGDFQTKYVETMRKVFRVANLDFLHAIYTFAFLSEKYNHRGQTTALRHLEEHYSSFKGYFNVDSWLELKTLLKSFNLRNVFDLRMNELGGSGKVLDPLQGWVRGTLPIGNEFRKSFMDHLRRLTEKMEGFRRYWPVGVARIAQLDISREIAYFAGDLVSKEELDIREKENKELVRTRILELLDRIPAGIENYLDLLDMIRQAVQNELNPDDSAPENSILTLLSA